MGAGNLSDRAGRPLGRDAERVARTLNDEHWDVDILEFL
jgi:hypothetical protein